MSEDTAGALTSPSKRKTVHNVCVVGAVDEETIGILEDCGLNVIKSDTGIEHTNNQKEDLVFLVSDFESHIFVDLHGSSVGTGQVALPDNRLPVSIMGPPYVKYFHRRNWAIPLPMPTRPRFCTIMSDVSIVIELKRDSNYKRRVVDLVHFMGGSARKDVVQRTTHFITDSARGKNFRVASAMGKTVVRPSWVFDSWAQKDCLDFDVHSPEFLSSHKLLCFEGIRMCLIGFNDKDTEEMGKMAVEKNGTIVVDPEQATHIIYDSNFADPQSINVHVHQKQVTAKWFWESVEAGISINESEFWPGNKKLKRQSIGVQRSSRASLLENSTSSILSDGMYSTDDLGKAVGTSPDKVDKKHQVVMEMLGTEERYIQALELLISMRNRLESASNEVESWIDRNPNEGITKADVNAIFGKLSPIIHVHKQIHSRMKDVATNWSKDVYVGKIWTNFNQDLLKVYPPFINTYDTAKARFEDIDKNEKFHAFVRTCETDPSWQRCRVMDILIRPLQRLPSVVLLLAECLKRTDKGHADRTYLQEAITSLEKVLSRANESRRQAETYEKMMKLFDDIANFPSDLRSGSRELIKECLVVSLGGTGVWKECSKKVLKLLLFNDIIVICKVRQSEIRNGGTISRMQRHFSTASLFGDEKKRQKLKHISSIGLSFLRQIFAINTGDENISMYLLVIRDTGGDYECVVNADPIVGSDYDTVHNFMKEVESRVFWGTGRDAIHVECDIENLPDYQRDTALRSLNRSRPITYPGPAGDNPNLSTFGRLRRLVSRTSLHDLVFKDSKGDLSRVGHLKKEDPVVMRSPWRAFNTTPSRRYSMPGCSQRIGELVIDETPTGNELCSEREYDAAGTTPLNRTTSEWRLPSSHFKRLPIHSETIHVELSSPISRRRNGRFKN